MEYCWAGRLRRTSIDMSELIDLVNLAVGLETIGDDLKSDGVADGNHVDDGFAVFVGFELKRSLVLVALDGMEDDVSIVDGLAVVVANNGDLNVRRMAAGPCICVRGGSRLPEREE